MAFTKVGVGTVANDGTGDTLRTAMQAVNTALTALDGLAASTSAILDVAGGQIKFPGTQVPSANVNTLDDYEEGTFTPVLAFGGASVGITYATQLGHYQIVGNRIHIQIRVLLTSKGSSVGSATITGLPVAAVNTAGFFAPFSLVLSGMSSMSGLTQAYISPNTTAITLQQLGTGTAANLADTNFGAASEVMVCGSYER